MMADGQCEWERRKQSFKLFRHLPLSLLGWSLREERVGVTQALSLSTEKVCFEILHHTQE